MLIQIGPKTVILRLQLHLQTII